MVTHKGMMREESALYSLMREAAKGVRLLAERQEIERGELEKAKATRRTIELLDAACTEFRKKHGSK